MRDVSDRGCRQHGANRTSAIGRGPRLQEIDGSSRLERQSERGRSGAGAGGRVRCTPRADRRALRARAELRQLRRPAGAQGHRQASRARPAVQHRRPLLQVPRRARGVGDLDRGPALRQFRVLRLSGAQSAPRGGGGREGGDRALRHVRVGEPHRRRRAAAAPRSSRRRWRSSTASRAAVAFVSGHATNVSTIGTLLTPGRSRPLRRSLPQQRAGRHQAVARDGAGLPPQQPRRRWSSCSASIAICTSAR